MRGKTISALLIAVFFSSLVVNLGFAAPPYPNTVVSVSPSTIHGGPGDSFTVDIAIDNVKDVYAWEIQLQYHPYQAVIVTDTVTDGGFLAGGWFVWGDDVFAGVITAGSTLLGPVPGVSGSGILCSVTFFVAEAGESPLDLISVALLKRVNGDLIDMPVAHIQNGYYYGPTLDLVRLEISPDREFVVGETVTFDGKLRNDGNAPLYAYVTYEVERVEDQEYMNLRAGQWWYGLGSLPAPWWIDPLECNGYYVSWAEGYFGVYWNYAGSSPWLDVAGDSNYIWADETLDAAMSAGYEFEDITLDPKHIINDVVLEGYTWCDNINIDLDMYTVSPTIFDWIGSLWGTTTWGWHTPRWVGGASMMDRIPEVGSEAGLNAVELLAYHYAPNPVDYAGVMKGDALRLQVQLASKTIDPAVPEVYVVPPGGTLDVGSTTIGELHIEDVGHYIVRATAWYSWNGNFFNPSNKIHTRHYVVSN